MTTINACGVLVHVHPEYATEVRTKLEHEMGVEGHKMTEDSRLVVIVEKETQQSTSDTVSGIQEMDHVILAFMLYQYFNQDAESEWGKINRRMPYRYGYVEKESNPHMVFMSRGR